MTYKSVQRALELEFKNKWDPNIFIAWPNTGSKPDLEIDPDEDSNSPWVRFNISFGDGDHVALGGTLKQFRYVAVIIVQVYTAEGVGTQRNRKLCDDVAAIFRLKQIADENLTCETPRIVEVGTKDGWWQANVEIPLYWDEFTNP